MTQRDYTTISIEDMCQSEVYTVVDLLALAMQSNPINRAVFKSNNSVAIARQRKMFEYVTASPNNKVRVAKIGGIIVGVLCYCSSDRCQLRPWEIAVHLPSLALKMKGDLGRFLNWRMIWSKHDYKFRHLHIGPIAVHPRNQGRGIGSAMLEDMCRHLDATSMRGYLETDKPENVVLYERFGFSIEKVDTVLGVPNWFMVRE